MIALEMDWVGAANAGKRIAESSRHELHSYKTTRDCCWQPSSPAGHASTSIIILVYRNRTRNPQTYEAPLESQAQGSSIFTSAASNQKVCPEDSLWEDQVVDDSTIYRQ